MTADQNERVFEGHTGVISCLAFNHEESRLASGSSDTTTLLWDLERAGGPQVITLNSRPVIALAFSPDKRWLAVAANSDKAGSVHIVNMTAPEAPREFQSNAKVGAVSFSPDGRWLAGSDGVTAVHLWDVSSGRRVFTFAAKARWMVRALSRVVGSGPSKDGTILAFSPRGDVLASSLWDGVALWHVARKARVRALGGRRESRTVLLDFIDGGRSLIEVEARGSCRTWDVETGRESRAFSASAGSIYCAALDAQRGIVAISEGAGADGTITLWDVASGRLARTVTGIGYCHSLAVGPLARWLAVGETDRVTGSSRIRLVSLGGPGR